MTALLDFETRRARYAGALTAFARAQPQPHLLTGMPGNIGDHLIWAGTEDLLRRGGVGFERIPLAELAAAPRRQGTLLIPGGEAMHPFWGDWLPRAVTQAARSFARVVILPSGLAVRSPLGDRSLGLPNVHVMAREVTSFRAVRHLGRAALAMDCALSCARLTRAPVGARRGRAAPLVALREDPGSLLPAAGLRPDPEVNRDISTTAGSLDEWLDAIRGAETVVTDRLHVAVAALLMGRRVRWLETYGAKISTYMAFAFRDRFAAAAAPVSAEWLEERGYAVAGAGR